MAIETYTTHSDTETHLLGQTIGKTLKANAVVAFFGDLGAGKTTFIRGLVEGVGGTDSRNVASPTFNILNIYPGVKVVYHFDLYRLPRDEEFFAAGFDEHFTAGGICCIEWADKINSHLPPHTTHITLSHFGTTSRQIEITGGR
jgi:tRNA threonylcarbamoyladenosine biosynthesis protein TsaE